MGSNLHSDTSELKKVRGRVESENNGTVAFLP